MMYSIILSNISPLLSIGIFIAVLLKSQRSQERTTALIMLCLVMVLNISFALELNLLLATGIMYEIFLYIRCIAVCLLPVALLYFSKISLNNDWQPKARHALFLVIPFISTVIISTNPLHHWFFVSISANTSEMVYGVYFYIHSLYSYSLMFVGIIILVIAAVRSFGFFSKQLVLVSSGTLIYLIVNILYTFGIGNMPSSITSIALDITLIFIIFAFLRFRFTASVPISLRQVIDLVSDGYLVVDRQMHITVYNKAMLSMFPEMNEIPVGSSLRLFAERYLIDISYDQLLELQAHTVEFQKTASMEGRILGDTFVSVEITPVMRRNSHIGSIMLIKNTNLSMLDQLTEIPNRRNFDNRISAEWTRAIRGNSSICLLMMDVDHFKKYNDTYGHQQGDVALKTVAHTIYKSLKRSTDFAARWGGEEFVAVLPYSDSDGGLATAELIRSNIESAEVFCEDGTCTKITASIGANVHSPTQSCSLEEFISRADQALYSAKNEGRNKVCFFTDNSAGSN